MNRMYVITGENGVQPVEVTCQPLACSFASVEEFAEIVADWPLSRLVAVWNKLPGVRPLARFENRAIAVQRIWRALQGEQQPARGQRHVRQHRARQTKTQLVLRMLRQPEGATLQALMKATQWQAHSVRGFLSRKVTSSLGLALQSTKRDGERVYALPPETTSTDH